MVKYRWLILLLVLSLLFVACDGDDTGLSDVDEDLDGEIEPEEVADDVDEEVLPGEDGEEVTLVIESWRNDDLLIWQDVIIPAFEEDHPNINVEFQPSAPAEYNGVLNSKLEAGTAGDLITCRPFDASLELFQQGHLAPLNDLAGLDNFSDVAKSAWVTDDGDTIFCVPMASVIHGFIYNADIFAELGLDEPETQEEFMATLAAIDEDGQYIPLVMGTADMWEAATMGFQNIGPNFWAGEEGRQALIAGEQTFNDQAYIETWRALAAWAPYLPDGYEAVKYPDAQTLFTLGEGAIYPAGSWEIALFETQADFAMGAFPPPLPQAGDTCYISDHTDIAMGMNANTEHPEAAATFLEWLTTAEFAELYSNELPGFFTLSQHDITLENELAQEFLSWRETCEETIRNSYQILSRGEPNLENELWRVSAAVINGNMTPEQAADEVQAGLEQWYEPQQ